MSDNTPAERARRQSGFTLEQAARLARLHPRRLRHYELNGGATDATARRLCHFYQAGADVFHALLFGPDYQTSSYSGGVAASIPSTPEAAGRGSGVAAPEPSQPSRRYRTPRVPMLTAIPGQQE